MLLSLQWFWLVPLLYLTSLREVEAQFPRPCTTNEALKYKECCPDFEGSPCGVRSGRGFCASYTGRLNAAAVDYRVNWPHFFYVSVCECKENFDGYDCSQCLPGWKGPKCQEPHRVQRKEITDMTDLERETFLSSLDLAKRSHSSRYMILSSNDTTVPGNYEFENSTVYNLYVWMHYYAAKNYAGENSDSAHKGPAFLFWHRVFLLFIEREIRDLIGNIDFYIPYWDWTRTDFCNICINDYFGAVGNNGHIDDASRFSKWETLCPYDESLGIVCLPPEKSHPGHITRFPGNNPEANTLPTYDDVENIIKTPNFDTPPYDRRSKESFRNQLEGFDLPQDQRHLQTAMHNLVHDYLNGTMSLLPTAANDPLFMVHHSNVDRILDRWLKSHPNATYPVSDLVHPAQRANVYMAPYFPLRTNEHWWNQTIDDLGYSFLEHSVPHPRATSNPEKCDLASRLRLLGLGR